MLGAEPLPLGLLARASRSTKDSVHLATHITEVCLVPTDATGSAISFLPSETLALSLQAAGLLPLEIKSQRKRRGHPQHYRKRVRAGCALLHIAQCCKPFPIF